MAKVYTVRYLMDDETGHLLPLSLPQKRTKDEKEKQEEKKKNEKMKWKRRK